MKVYSDMRKRAGASPAGGAEGAEGASEDVTSGDVMGELELM